MLKRKKMTLLLGTILMFVLIFGLTFTGCTTADTDDTPAAPKEGNDVSVETPEQFYQGKVIEFMIPFSPGGGYDAIARGLAPFIQKYTGASAVVIVNQPGAGGLVAYNSLYHSKPDGLKIAAMHGGTVPLSYLQGAEGVSYNPAEFNYLGTLEPSAQVLMVTANYEYDSFEDLVRDSRDGKVILYACTTRGTNFTETTIMADTFDMNLEVVTGFPGNAEILVAMQQGIIDISTSTASSFMHLVEAGEMRYIVQKSAERHPSMPDIPTLREVAVAVGIDDEKLDFMLRAHAPIQMGRLIGAPPGVSPEKVEFLRDSIEKARTDPEYIALAERTGVDTHHINGADVQRMIEVALAMSEEDLKRIDEITDRY